jgi:hypothetical protein
MIIDWWPHFPPYTVVALLYNAIWVILIYQNATRSIELIAADKKFSDAYCHFYRKHCFSIS